MALDPVTAVLDIGNTLIQRLFPDPAQAAEAKLKLIELQQNGELATLAADTDLAKGQLTVNVEEAKSASLFVAGWRPFVGWVCGTGFAIQVLGPLLTWITALFGHKTDFPPLDFSVMGPTLATLLGVAGMRTYEKFKGVEGNR